MVRCLITSRPFQNCSDWSRLLLLLPRLPVVCCEISVLQSTFLHTTRLWLWSSRTPWSSFIVREKSWNKLLRRAQTLFLSCFQMQVILMTKDSILTKILENNFRWTRLNPFIKTSFKLSTKAFNNTNKILCQVIRNWNLKILKLGKGEWIHIVYL